MIKQSPLYERTCDGYCETCKKDGTQKVIFIEN